MLRSISVLDLPQVAKLKLKGLGYEYCDDLKRALLNSDAMSHAIKALFDYYKISEVLGLEKSPNIITAADLWNFECYNPAVSIFHKGFDQLLNGGFPIGRLTEICGPPGSGKTQICFQAAIDVQIPCELGGSGGECLFISTDFGFRVERLRQMALESVRHVSDAQNASTTNSFTLETILKGVNVIKICGYKKLHDVIMNLENYLENNKNSVKLLVIDSFGLPFVCEITNLLQRTQIIHILMDKLQELSVKYKLAVLLTNQLTTVMTSSADKKLIPSLGESFSHRLHKRILLNEGKACLVKSIDQPQLLTKFQITAAGIR